MPDKVGFVIAGVQKGGTTALFDYLRLHPDLTLPDMKEVHFFDDESVDWSRPDYGAYEAAVPPRGSRLRGEATPIYIYWPNSLERMRDYNPDMRLIIVFRDPVERAWSQWRMEQSRTEREPFAWAIREGRARVDDPAAPGAHRIHSYVERGFYGEQLRRLLAIFPRQQVLLLRSEDLRANPAWILGNACDFLSIQRFAKISPIESLVGPQVSEGASITASDREYLQTIYSLDQQLFYELSGFDYRTGWR